MTDQDTSSGRPRTPPPPVRALNPTRVPCRGGPGIRGHWLYRAVSRNPIYRVLVYLARFALELS